MSVSNSNCLHKDIIFSKNPHKLLFLKYSTIVLFFVSPSCLELLQFSYKCRRKLFSTAKNILIFFYVREKNDTVCFGKVWDHMVTHFWFYWNKHWAPILASPNCSDEMFSNCSGQDRIVLEMIKYEFFQKRNVVSCGRTLCLVKSTSILQVSKYYNECPLFERLL